MDQGTTAKRHLQLGGATGATVAEDKPLDVPDIGTAGELLRLGFRPSVVRELLPIGKALVDALYDQQIKGGRDRSSLRGQSPRRLDVLVHRPTMHLQATAFVLCYEVAAGDDLEHAVTASALCAAYRSYDAIFRRELGPTQSLEITPALAYMAARSVQKGLIKRTTCQRCEQIHLKLMTAEYVGGLLSTGECPFCEFHHLNTHRRRPIRQRKVALPEATAEQRD